MKRTRDNETDQWEAFVSSIESTVAKRNPSEVHYSFKRIRMFHPRHARLNTEVLEKFKWDDRTPNATLYVDSNAQSIVLDLNYEVKKKVRFGPHPNETPPGVSEEDVFPEQIARSLRLTNRELLDDMKTTVLAVAKHHPKALDWDDVDLPYKIIVHKPMNQLILRFPTKWKHIEAAHFGTNGWYELSDAGFTYVRVFCGVV